MKFLKPTGFILVGAMGLSASNLSIAQDNSGQTVMDNIVSDFSDFLGENTDRLVNALSSGDKLSYDIVSDDGTIETVIVENRTGSTSYGEITIALGLAEEQLGHDALFGDIVTLLYGDKGILDMRASGMGWGQVYQKYGLTVGEVMRDVRANDNANFRRAETTSVRISSIGEQAVRPDRPDLPERAVRPDRPDLPERPVRPDRPDLPERAVRPDRPLGLGRL